VARDPGERSPRVLVLGAGPAQLGLLESARANGFWTAVADRDPAAPGFQLADRRCIVSTEDEPAIERLAGALDLDGLIAPGTDWPVAVAARVAEKLGLPHPISPATAVLATNKLRQRERLAAADVPQPRWQVVSDREVELEVPLVVKAPDRQGQRGMSLVLDEAELPEAVELARAYSRADAALVEQLVEGPEVTVIGFSVEGEYLPLVVTDRLTAEAPAFGVALAHVFPSPQAAAAVEVASRAVAALGIENGPSYTQLRIGPAGPEVIEVAARLGGGHDAELVEAVTAIDLNRLALGAAVGETVLPGPAQARVGAAVTRFLIAPEGRIESVDVPEQLDGVVRVRIYRDRGYVVGPLRRATDRAGAILVVGETRAEVLALADAAAERIRFVTSAAGALV
jgi:biotin carboxylase